MMAIWRIRENISEGYKSCGAVFYYDISLPIDYYYTLVDDMRKHMGNKCERVFGYGHLGKKLKTHSTYFLKNLTRFIFLLH
ncbi:hypothetical protein NQ314_017603 [Rhamnusium bicolor]|uniref:D-2-hydroxyglutarate dehydrogenase, mitochondrial n=1 Tax=Rhamnusium bicolor TaxID=1586634 RepID=A0AAV8WU22_9CUCU|nr:hypothetical protein NQ314_017603 [Rhamnusium bicolor]